jgi:competence protein ComGC
MFSDRNCYVEMTESGTFTKISRLQKNISGFSVPELLVVCLIISILVVISLPGAVRTLQLYRLDGSVSIISDKIVEARMNAIKRNRRAWLRIDATAKTAQVRSTNSAGQTIDVNSPERLPRGLGIDSTSPVEIGFDSMGRLATTTQGVTIIESNSNKRKTITISPSGKVSVGQMH